MMRKSFKKVTGLVLVALLIFSLFTIEGVLFNLWDNNILGNLFIFLINKILKVLNASIWTHLKFSNIFLA